MPYPQEPETIGDHLKKRRYDLSLFQKEVALRLSVNDLTICNWENNKSTPAVHYLPRIIKFLGYYPYSTPGTLGERLLRFRRYRGLTRREMAQRRLSVDEGTLARWEKGEVRPTGKRLQRVKDFLAVNELSAPTGGQ